MKFEVRDPLAPWTSGWPDAALGPWDVTLHWREDDEGAVVCTGYDVRLREGVAVRPWTTTEHRRLRLNELITAAKRARYEDSGGDVVDAVDDGHDIEISGSLVEDLRAQSSGWLPTRRAARRPADDRDELRAIAITYSQALAAARPALATVMTRHHLSKATASRRIKSARDAGLLPPTRRGVGRGSPRLLDEGAS